MTDQIKDSFEARNVLTAIIKQLNSLPYNPDLRKYLKNIDCMVGELSSLEAEARRTKKFYKVKEHNVKLLAAIKHLENLVLILRLMN